MTHLLPDMYHLTPLSMLGPEARQGASSETRAPLLWLLKSSIKCLYTDKMETTGTMQMDFEYYDDLFFMVQA